MTSFHLLLVFIALTVCRTMQSDAIEDLATSGGYRTVYYKATTSGFHAAYLQALNPSMQSEPASRADGYRLRYRIARLPRFFLETNNNFDNVRRVFEDIVNASTVAEGRYPTLICADTDEKDLRRQLLGRCHIPSRPVMNIIQPAKIVSICPIY